MADPQALDTVIHAPVRLAIMSVLVTVERCAFTELRDLVGTSDGNLSSHLSRLEAAGFVEVDKRFVDRKPLTTYALTARGRAAFLAYLDALNALLPKRDPRG